jgi:hypothetical protein
MANHQEPDDTDSGNQAAEEREHEHAEPDRQQEAADDERDCRECADPASHPLSVGRALAGSRQHRCDLFCPGLHVDPPVGR